MGRTNERTRLWSVLPFAGAAVWACLSGCSTDKSDPNGPVSSTDCHELLSAYCSKLASCDPVALRRQFDDLQGCVARQSLACPSLSLPGTAWTSGKIQQCTREINASTSCGNDVFEAAACQNVPGTLTQGMACEQSSQCASERCDRSSVASPDGGLSSPACGLCSAEGDAGAPSGRCGDGPTCQSPERCVYDSNLRNSRCMLPQPEGAPCTTTSSACAAGLSCKRSAFDGGASVCSPRGAAGASCTYSEECDATRGVRCIAGVCNTPIFVSLGETCDTTGRLCEKGARCSSSGSPTGICQAPAEDGSRCDSTVGPYCRDPASCRDGICHLPGEAQCR
jgi:hypothetical protein